MKIKKKSPTLKNIIKTEKYRQNYKISPKMKNVTKDEKTLKLENICGQCEKILLKFKKPQNLKKISKIEKINRQK